MSSFAAVDYTPGPVGKQSVELYVRTSSTMLQSSGDIRIRALEPAHIATRPVLHPLAGEGRVDMGALLYSVRRLPTVIAACRRVVLGQSAADLRGGAGFDIRSWKRVMAPARRRRWYHDGEDTLAVMIASPSDVDDLVPILVAYQIEWNKIHRLLKGVTTGADLPEALEVSADDWGRLQEAWGLEASAMLARLRDHECNLSLRMVGGTSLGFARGADRWWMPVSEAMESLGVKDAPIYFVSSNLHSLVNVMTGVARRLQSEIHEWIGVHDPGLGEEYHRISRGESRGSVDNWLYFAARSLFDEHPDRDHFRHLRAELEARDGVRHVPAVEGLDSAAQILQLSSLDSRRFDPRIGAVDPLALAASEAVILNIDYPLGLAAYDILRQVAIKASHVAGVYVMGKAATLNADVGDVLIPNVVFNEHSGNTYWLDNCFSAGDVQPHLVFGSVLDNQRAATVRSTFLQNHDYLEFYYQGHYTVIEMEAGPYLDAAYEMARPDRHPVGENVSMTRLGFDLGIVHYASDTPYTQARTLGARGLSYRGMDSTYASAVAVARRILQMEGALL